jgi:uncharacterized protein (DUF433 family)
MSVPVARGSVIVDERSSVMTDPKEDPRVMIDPDMRGGQPTVRGTRIAVAEVLDWLAYGMSIDEIIADYPTLDRTGILGALEWSATVVDEAAARRASTSSADDAVSANDEPPLGERPIGIDDELWDILNQATVRPLSVDEAQLTVAEITGLRQVASRAMDRLGTESWVHEERGFALSRSAEENERLRNWIRFAAELVDTGRFGNPEASARAATALMDALNPDRPAPLWERPDPDRVVVVKEHE